MGPSCYMEFRGIRNRTIRGLYYIYIPRNKLQWNFYPNSRIFIQGNTFEKGVCKMASISSRPQWVKNLCDMQEGQAFPHDTKFCTCRAKILVRKAIVSWSLIDGWKWSSLIKTGPGDKSVTGFWADFILLYFFIYLFVLCWNCVIIFCEASVHFNDVAIE